MSYRWGTGFRLAAVVVTMTIASCSTATNGAGLASPTVVTTAPPSLSGEVDGRVLECAPQIHGHTVGLAGPRVPRPGLPPQIVEALRGSELVASTQVDKDGNYYLTLDPGQYTLRQGRAVGAVTVTRGITSLEWFVCGRATGGEN
jgi:hypothetical protein